MYSVWLKEHGLKRNDAILVLSVGGGSEERRISLPLIEAIKYSKEIQARVLVITGKADGFAAKQADKCILLPSAQDRLTPHSEELMSVMAHLLCSHPRLTVRKPFWESIVNSVDQPESVQGLARESSLNIPIRVPMSDCGAV